MHATRICGRLLAIVHAVVAHHGRNPQAVVGKDATAPGLLGAAVGVHLPPPGHGRFVAPEREGQQLARLAQALEPLDGDEPIDLLQQRPQRGCGAEVGVLLAGRSALGARRWIALGPISLQPSELFKLAFIGTLAVYLAARESTRPGWDRVVIPLALTLPAVGLIVKQPDLGTALTLLPVAAALIIVGGARWRHLGLIAGGIGLIARSVRSKA